MDFVYLYTCEIINHTFFFREGARLRNPYIYLYSRSREPGAKMVEANLATFVSCGWYPVEVYLKFLQPLYRKIYYLYNMYDAPPGRYGTTPSHPRYMYILMILVL